MNKEIGRLTRKQQIKIILQFCGWNSTRKIASIKSVLAYFRNKKFEVNEPIERWLQTYFEINSVVYIGRDDLYDGQPVYQFVYQFTLEQSELVENTQDFKDILQFSQEQCLPLGTFGYYYDGVVAIGLSGTLYIKHDYSEDVAKFDSMTDLISYELRTIEKITAISNTSSL
ncbi:hypothetical protein IGI37_002620 [Enterococcus sp. AZ194]|uniref:hypothetical protein n=1 Tax=Enterococcus sp. AZ194 TaxID=2774629 RepID=UPI003F1FDCE0